MTVSWLPVMVVDIVGSMLSLAIALSCARLAWRWTREKPADNFRQYILLLTLAIVFFAVSRSFGHLIKQLLLINQLDQIWKAISPFSGAVNSAAFVIIFSFSVYFHRFQKVHAEVESYRNNLEQLIAQRTTQLEEKNIALQNEIIERRKVENDLRQSKTTLENILNSTIPLCITDTNHDIILANNAYRALWPKQTAGSGRIKCYESRPGPNCHTEICPLHRIIGGTEEVTLDSVKYDEQGNQLDFLITAKAFRDADGRLVGIVENFLEITQRKQAQEALAAEKERLAVTLRSIGDGVITTDTRGNIVLLNKVAEQLTGWSQTEAVDKPLAEVFQIIDATSRTPVDNPAVKVLAEGTIIELANHIVLIARDGTEKKIADSAAPIHDKESQTIGVVVVFRDVTARLKMEEELLKAKKLESVGVLAGGIAHDFNNILVAILGNIGLAREIMTNAPEESLFLLEEAEKASWRAKNLTQQLLTFSKGGAPIIETASVTEIIKESADFVLHGGKVSCRYHFPADLWLAAIDKGQMSQVIQNLILNARQAMPKGGFIDISCENIQPTTPNDTPLPAGEYVRIMIKDAGSGMSPEILARIFDPYFSTREKGSGLGLAITHSIIEKHHGHISVSSTPGVGTTFTITLPANPDGEIIPPAAPSSAAIMGHGRILIMDDEVIVRNIVSKMLVRLGYEVTIAKDGQEAIDLFSQAAAANRSFDATIMDLTVPGGMGGQEAGKEILNLAPDARLIVSSGYSNDPVMANYREYGFRGAIQKPYRTEELGEVLKKILA